MPYRREFATVIFNALGYGLVALLHAERHYHGFMPRHFYAFPKFWGGMFFGPTSYPWGQGFFAFGCVVVLLCTISVVAPLRDGSKGLLLCMAAPQAVALLALSTYAFPIYYLLPAACLTLTLPAAGLVAVLDLLSGSKRIFDWRRAVLWVSNLFLAYLIALEIDWFNIRIIGGS